MPSLFYWPKFPRIFHLSEKLIFITVSWKVLRFPEALANPRSFLSLSHSTIIFNINLFHLLSLQAFYLSALSFMPPARPICTHLISTNSVPTWPDKPSSLVFLSPRPSICLSCVISHLHLLQCYTSHTKHLSVVHVAPISTLSADTFSPSEAERDKKQVGSGRVKDGKCCWWVSKRWELAVSLTTHFPSIMPSTTFSSLSLSLSPFFYTHLD